MNVKSIGGLLVFTYFLLYSLYSLPNRVIMLATLLFYSIDYFTELVLGTYEGTRDVERVLCDCIWEFMERSKGVVRFLLVIILYVLSRFASSKV